MSLSAPQIGELRTFAEQLADAEQWVPLLTVDVPVVPAALRNNAGIVGAAMAAHSHVAP